jgi:cytochrome c5
MKHLREALTGLLLLAAVPFLALANGAPKPQQSQSNAKAAPPASPDRGQQIFEQNCSRCHNAPEGFSPRIAGTIARHMRIRAGLSDQDYQALRRFLSP